MEDENLKLDLVELPGGRTVKMEFSITAFKISWKGKVKNCHGGNPVNCETGGALI